MKYVRRSMLAAAFGLALAFGAPAQDKAEDLTQGFRAFVVNEPRFPADDVRNRTGKMPDLVDEHGLNPVIAVFSKSIPNKAESAVGSIVKATDDLADKYKAKKLGAFVVFLALKDEFRKHDPDNTRDARLDEVKRFVNGAKPARTTIGLAEATEMPGTEALVPAQVKAMGIDAEDDLVIVFYHQFRVVKRWKFKAGTAPSEAELADLTATVVKTLGPAGPAKK